MKRYYTFIVDAAIIAFQSIFAHKLRAFLTLLGIIFGVASVVVVSAAINGFNAYIMSNLTKLLGANTFFVSRVGSVSELTDEEWEQMVKRNKKIRWEELKWVRSQCKSCEVVGAERHWSADMKFQNQEIYGTDIAGVTPEIAAIRDMKIAEGRFFIPYEVEHAMPLCIIGMDLREKFFPSVDPIGKSLHLGSESLTIIGVESKLGSMFGTSLDNNLYLPLPTFERIYGKGDGIDIRGSAPNRLMFPTVVDEVRVLMRIIRGLQANREDTFVVIDTAQINNQIDSFTGAVATVVIPITLISLVVGGIVVMNIMLVSVTERTFEIGLRKAIGATQRQIMAQFLIESSALTSLGGLLGLLLAALISWTVRMATPVPMTITLFYMVLSVVFSGGIGMIAGIYPAYKASRLDPIVALARSG